MLAREVRPIEALVGALLGVALLACAYAAAAQAPPAVADQVTDRLIVRLAEWADADRAQPMSAERARTLGAMARTRIDPLRRMSGGAQVVRLTHAMPLAEVEALALRLMADPAVAHAEPDRRKFALLVPTDPLYRQQWTLFETVGGINAPRAWDVTTGSPSVVVAILDSGIRPANLDLAGRLAPGYDFVREDAPGLALTANDGDGRDADASDPGNWVAAGEAGLVPFQACPTPEDSNWHGTHIAGIVAASANNAYGIAGIAWRVRVLPGRVLGKCGGYTSDIIDAIRWSVGLAVPGVPANANPAQVINLSLGAAAPCSVEEQRAIDDALAPARSRAIVAAAGNDGGASVGIAPGNCRGVITVTATDRQGARARYAAIGANVAIAAPGGSIAGGAAGAVNGVLSLFNTGRTVPAADAFAFAAGTSEAAAHVSGVAALVLSLNAALTADELRALLRRTARAFPDSTCTTSSCGAGIVDAGAAVLAALPQTQIGSPVPATPAPAAPTPPPLAVATAPAATPPPAAPPPVTVASPAAGASGGGGGGGGGCTIARDGAPDLALPLLALWAAGTLLARRRYGPRGAPCA